MNLPDFNATASLYRTEAHYHTANRPFSAGQPEQRLSLAIEDVPFPRPRPMLSFDLPCFIALPNPLPTGPRILYYEVPCR